MPLKNFLEKKIGSYSKKNKISEIYGCYTAGLLIKQTYQYFKKNLKKVILELLDLILNQMRES